MVERTTRVVDGADGWQLVLHRFHVPSRVDRARRPVVIFPGYAMNSFIFGYHPRGSSLAEYLALRGHEVWCADLRAQGESRWRGAHQQRCRTFGLLDVGLVDVAAAIDGVLDQTILSAESVDALGCSLGATYLFMQAAWGTRPRIARIVNLGGPMRWTDTPGIARVFARIPRCVHRIPLRGTRRLARRALPIAARIPGLLHVYLHPAICDLSNPEALSQTVEDPVPSVNAEISKWIRERDLIYTDRGWNLTQDLRVVRTPLLTIVANADGIVPEPTVRSADLAIGSDVKSVLTAGSHAHPMAHADLFISDFAESEVFSPLADWLRETQDA